MFAQTIEAPNDARTGRATWGRAIYAADGTLLDVVVYDDTGAGWPPWTSVLVRLPPVKVTAGEFERWVRHGAEARQS